MEKGHEEHEEHEEQHQKHRSALRALKNYFEKLNLSYVELHNFKII